MTAISRTPPLGGITTNHHHHHHHRHTTNTGPHVLTHSRAHMHVRTYSPPRNRKRVGPEGNARISSSLRAAASSWGRKKGVTHSLFVRAEREVC